MPRKGLNEAEFKAKVDSLYNGEIELAGRYVSLTSPILVKDNSTNYFLLNNKDEITNYELSKSSIPLENKKPKKK